MATVIDAPEKLAQYMLKGWILTDQPCTAAAAGCRLPLLRSADHPVKFYCANCDEEKSPQGLATLPPPSASSSSSRPSPSSTPPTEVSSRSSSLNFEPPPETAESRFRRQQSDTASAEIGKRLLQGWAMLADECANPECFGVPLVRPPKPGGGKDPKKECVICGTVYISQIDSNGFEQLTHLNPPTVGTSQGPAPANKNITTSSAKEKGKSKAVEQEDDSMASFLKIARSLQESDPYSYGPPPPPDAGFVGTTRITPPPHRNASLPALIMAATSLESSLHALSQKMLMLTNGQIPLDPPAIGITADAIARVTEALAKVKQLHWSESRVSS